MQILNTSGNECSLRRQESKVKADWIKDGVGDSFDAAANQLILF